TIGTRPDFNHSSSNEVSNSIIQAGAAIWIKRDAGQVHVSIGIDRDQTRKLRCFALQIKGSLESDLSLYAGDSRNTIPGPTQGIRKLSRIRVSHGNQEVHGMSDAEIDVCVVII